MKVEAAGTAPLPHESLPTFLQDDKHSLVRLRFGSSMNGQERAYAYSPNDPETQQNLKQIKTGRAQAKSWLAVESSDPGIAKSNIKQAIDFFKKADALAKEKFGVIVFSESNKLFPGDDDQDRTTTTKTLRQHIVNGPHATRTTKEHYSGGGVFDLWNSGPYKSYSFKHDWNLQLNPSMKISSDESDSIKGRIVGYMKDIVHFPNPEHQRQIVLSAMMLNFMRLHCGASVLRPLSRAGISLSLPGGVKITRDFHEETMKLVRDISKLPGLGRLAEIADDVKEELNLETQNWKDTKVSGRSFYHEPLTFGLY